MRHAEDFNELRSQMVFTLRSRGIRDEMILQAMRTVPRHFFVPEAVRVHAYADSALGIAYNQTISQPYFVAFMIQSAQLDKNSTVLEIGTGSGYQAAVLSLVCNEVHTVETVPQLANNAFNLFETLQYTNIHTKVSDGHAGWPEEAPFDAILVTAAARRSPHHLLPQLGLGGKIIVPLDRLPGTPLEDNYAQRLVRITKVSLDNNYLLEDLLPVRFVPMVGLINKSLDLG